MKGPVTAKRGTSVSVPVVVTVAKGYHVTSSEPGDRYLKPLRLTWDAGALNPAPPHYPKAILRQYPFSEGKLSVLEGAFTIEQEFRVPASAPQGFGALTGKLHYQACTDTECLPPAIVPIRLSYDLR
ncbi:MAG: protein-disulfide reductase DsbD N-terminal domain-containing protein [Bryobacterales bacterium]|nr:protein-disulfide reductase DsbD N-terminal domain-containing protein [Bryobacterales bacterium]